MPLTLRPKSFSYTSATDLFTVEVTDPFLKVRSKSVTKAVADDAGAAHGHLQDILDRAQEIIDAQAVEGTEDEINAAIVTTTDEITMLDQQRDDLIGI